MHEKIEKEITEINNAYDKINNEISETYNKKHENLLIEEKNIKEKLQNEVTKTKEKLENFLSNCNMLIRNGERINKGIKIYKNEKEKSVMKTLSYISSISRNIKEMKIILGSMIKNIKIFFNEKECKIKFEDYYINGIQLPKDIEFKDVTSKSLKVFWKLDDIKIEKIDNNKIKFRVDIKNDDIKDRFNTVYEGCDNNCFIDNLKLGTNYEVRICSIYDNIFSSWIIEKIKTDFVNESIILNQEDKTKLLNWLNPVLGGKQLYLKLIYRRGNDMSFKTFHLKCDKRGPTLIICKSQNEKFGGFTNIDWESPDDGIQIKDETPFIFSFNKNKKFNYTQKKCNSIYLSKNNGPDFYWDFVFNNQQKMMQVCYCSTKEYGYEYSIEPLVGDGSTKEIIVDEVEVFKVKTI